MGGAECVMTWRVVVLSETFRAAAEAGPCDILKLYNKNGSIINISERLAPNSRDTRYKLVVVAASYSKLLHKYSPYPPTHPHTPTPSTPSPPLPNSPTNPSPPHVAKCWSCILRQFSHLHGGLGVGVIHQRSSLLGHCYYRRRQST